MLLIQTDKDGTPIIHLDKFEARLENPTAILAVWRDRNELNIGSRRLDPRKYEFNYDDSREGDAASTDRTDYFYGDRVIDKRYQ